MLICSVASAQTLPAAKSKKPKTVKHKATTVKQTPDSLKLKEITNLLEVEDSLENLLINKVDPIDTTQLRKSKNAVKSKVKYTARDSIVYSADKKEVYLYGDAKVNFEDLLLTADYVKIELTHNLLHATYTKDTAGNRVGLPVFKQGEKDYKADQIKYNFKTKKGYLSEFKTKEGEGFVKGKNVIKNESNEFGIQHSYYTTCDADTPHFQITAAKLKVIPEKKVVGLWPNLVIEGINTPLVFPFAIFPIKKGQSSGLIIPQYGSDINRGFFFRGGGYYFGLGEHADIQLTGDIYSNLSWGEHTVFRYSNRYHYSGNLVFNYNENKYGLEEDPSFHQDKGFQLTWQHSQDPRARPGTNFSSNVNIVSSTYLANNSYNLSNIVSNQMNSSVSFGKSFANGKYNFNTSARVSQNTLTRDVSIGFPDFSYSVSSFAPFKPKRKPVADKWYENITTSYSMSFKNELNTKDSLLFKSRTATELNNFYDSTGRFGMMHSLPVQTSFKVMKYYTLSARVDMTDYMYYKTIRKVLDTTDKEHPIVRTQTVDGFENAISYRPSLQLATKYYGLKQFKKGPISAIRHVISPSLGVSYTPDMSESSYGYYKTYTDQYGKQVKYSIFERGIYGGPGNYKQGNADFSLDNTLELKVWKGKDTARKEEKVQIFESVRAGGFYNFFADSLNLSTISLSARTRLFKNITLNGSANLDPYQNVFDVSSTGYKSVRRINQFSLNNNGGLGTITNGQVGVSASFNRDMIRGKTYDKKGYEGELKYLNDFPSEYIDFNVPWTLSVNYVVTYNKYNTLNDKTANNFAQTLSYSGDFNLTKKWKIMFSSGYDFRNNAPSITSINIIRDLHCWEWKFDWIPFGYRQSFLFTIHVKSSILQELKQTRRRDWADRTI